MKIVAAMSGGVDSTVAAALLLEKGFEVVGVTMRLWDGFGETPPRRCCSPEDIESAVQMARVLGIHHEIVDFREEFFKNIVQRFCDEYLQGLTPNPCVVCNEVIKSQFLLEYAKRVGAEAIATGHYAIVKSSGEAIGLFKGVDEGKDQSYFLHRIPPLRLKHLFLPAGTFKKEEIRQIARKMNLKVASKAESQELCFATPKGYSEVVERFGRVNIIKGLVIYKGKVLYEHNGIHNFTIGKRCGYKHGPNHRIFVKSIDPETGIVEAGEREDLLSNSMVVKDVVWHIPEPEKMIECTVKIRYRSKEVKALLEPVGASKVFVKFSEPQFAVTPGQAAVFYSDRMIIGGGWIDKGG